MFPFRNVSALWWLYELISLTFNSWMWNVFQLSGNQRNVSLQIFHAFCQTVIRITLALGDVWLKPCFFPSVAHIIAFSSQPQCFFRFVCVLDGGCCFCQTTTSPLHFWFQGELNKVWWCSSFVPLLPVGNQLIIHSHSFLEMEQANFKFASCAVGRNIHCCIHESCWVYFFFKNGIIYFQYGEEKNNFTITYHTHSRLW